jgi:hypothetical protein
VAKRKRKKRKKKSSPPPSATALKQVFEEHLPYEIVRLVEIYHLLLTPAPYRTKLANNISETVDDALIVGFCTHARNLLEFFFRKDRTEYNYALATDYAEASYQRLNREREDVKKLYGQLCAQINHLTYGRTDDNSKKIGPSERKALVDLIKDEAVRLERKLKPDYNRHYLYTDLLNRAAKMEIKAGAIGPSSQVSFITENPAAPVTTSTPPSKLAEAVTVLKKE